MTAKRPVAEVKTVKKCGFTLKNGRDLCSLRKQVPAVEPKID